MTKASARHIFVLSYEECEQLKSLIEAGADFAACAKKHSICPTGKNGGKILNVSPGKLIKELDQVIFNEEPGKLIGPIESDYGYHLVEITKRG
jgi:peptidyl-prolyl cis-trans isomerase C